jgi:glutaredoxin
MQNPGPFQLVMYARLRPCPFVNTARKVLSERAIPHQEIMIDADEAARRQVIAWTGFESVPTLILAYPGQAEPYEAPAYLAPGESPRGIDRGPMLTEPSAVQLEDWLRRHGLLA